MSANPVTRRTALKYAGLISLTAHAWRMLPTQAAAARAHPGEAAPDLSKRTVTWSRSLSTQQLATLAALCDIVLPAEPPHPSAGSVAVHEFLDEWVSAPYPKMQADRTILLGGLAALDQAMRQERGVDFVRADAAQQSSLFERFCRAQATAGFTARLIELTCDGYYTTREGHTAIGYVGNVALAAFPPPTPETVQHLQQTLDRLHPKTAQLKVDFTRHGEST